MEQNKNRGQQRLQDETGQDEQSKKQLRQTSMDEQNDTAKKGDKTTLGRKDNHGRKQ